MTVTNLKYPQCADDHGEEWEVENQQRDEEDEELDCEVGDDKEEDKCVDVVRGDQGAEPLHAGPWRPVDEVLLDLQQSVQRELQQLEKHKRGEGQRQYITKVPKCKCPSLTRI